MWKTSGGPGGHVVWARSLGPTATRLAIALSIALLSTAPSVAQGPGDRFALDNCYNIYTEAGKAVRCDIYVFDPGGSGHVYTVGEHTEPSLSPDGSHLAFTDGSQLAVVNLLTGAGSIVDNPDVWIGSLRWSFDGRIAFPINRGGGTWELNVMNANGTGLRQVTTAVGFRGWISWSADGRIAFECELEAGNLDICVIHADGTGYTRLTQTAQDETAPMFSPADDRIAFRCEIEVGNYDICVIHADGTGYTRLTHTAERDEGAPVFSPGGTRIAFYTASGFSILNADGSVIDLGVWGPGIHWTTDGTRLVYHKSTVQTGCDADGTLCGYAVIYAVNVDGTGVTLLGGGANPSLARSTGGLPAFAYFTATCTTTLVCTFDSSLSTGERPIVQYEWDYGDGTTGQSPIHSYTSAGSYAVNLTVVDDAGARASWRRTVTVSEFPIASFTVECDGLSCVFNGTGSYDPDGIGFYAWDFGDGYGTSHGDVVSYRYVSTGTYPVTLWVLDRTGAEDIATSELTVTNRRPVAMIQFSCAALRCDFTGSPSSDDGTIVSYAWNFGDGTQAASVSPIHMFAAAGTYSVVLTVTDNAGETGTAEIAVTVVAPIVMPPMHVGDLDGSGSRAAPGSWNADAIITVHDADHRPVPGAVVIARWSTGPTSSCATDASGRCVLTATNLPNKTGSALLTIVTVTHDGFVYLQGANHDPDGGSNGTAIRISR